MPRLIPTLCLGLLTVSMARADVTAENAFDFLRLADLKVHVQMSFDAIDWIEDEGAADERLARLEAVLAGDPRDLQAACELIDLYDRYKRSSEAAAVAKRTLPAFREQMERNRDESSALGFAKAALAAKARDEYNGAYRALQPYLESGRAGRETCITAIGILMKTKDYGLAKRIAEHYLRIDPRFAELHYRLYCISIAENLLARVTEIVQASARGEFQDTAGARDFVARSLEDLAAGIDSRSLLRAIELEPANYEYLLNRCVLETLSYLLIKAYLQLLIGDGGDVRPGELLQQAVPSWLPQLREHLAQAEAIRPKCDIQVYLVGAVANTIFDELDEAEVYARLAVETRPDLPEGYDALLLSILVPFMDGETDISPEAREKAGAIYADKVSHSEASAEDHFGLASLVFSGYGEVDAEARGPVLARAKHCAEKTLEIDPRFIPGLILAANVHIISKEPRRAMAILENIPEPEDPELKSAVLHTLGIARILAGDREGGTADLRRALELQPENQATRDALQELGLDPGGQ